MSFLFYGVNEIPTQPIRIPVPVPSNNRKFLEQWRESMQARDQHWQILEFDAQYQVYWIVIFS